MVDPDSFHQIKLPPFSKDDPELWFVQIERLFSRKQILLESDKADVLIFGLNSEILSCVKNIAVMTPSPVDIYS